MKKSKTILHIDGDAFFVGVEVAKNPKLKGLPVVTGQERGIVSALSYEAKALGITRGMSIYKVNKSYPKVIVLPGDYKSYVKYSKMMFDIVRRYADDVEEYSIDECFADLTGLNIPVKDSFKELMTYRQIAEKIKREVNDELDLPVSVGVAQTKVLAKIASNWQKPNGMTIIDENKISEFTNKIPVGKIWGVGPRNAEKLIELGVKTAHEFSEKDLTWVQKKLSVPYATIWQELNGISVLDIDSAKKTKYGSIQKTRSFHPETDNVPFLLSQLSKNIEEACTKARHYKLFPKEVAIFLKTQDFKFHHAVAVIPSPTNAPEPIIAICKKEFEKIYEEGIMYRTTGVTLHKLVPVESIQTDLFGTARDSDKFEIIHNQIDVLEKKFNKKMIHLASTHSALKHKKGTDSDDLDSDLLFL